MIQAALKNIKAVIGFLVLLLILASTGYGLYQKLRAERAVDNAKAATETLESTRAAIDSRHTAGKARAAEEQAATESLEAAIEANPDWGSARTPDAVVDSLCSYIPCAPGESAGGL